ncbi:hypothetical protein PLESTB_001554600 [Pleodorina starrii]|uniref:Uncharacterized protein n=1 Tax=Pleodorina starrii TaxID=330485 RepID=A0A9W6F872_9CHLO|nr:hypothetical protein PLESTM_001470600 [Pleodorina starrii]GLC59924.1 hypothetical protein PLESTB_001554600 [Pleodorina starrii]
MALSALTRKPVVARSPVVTRIPAAVSAVSSRRVSCRSQLLSTIAAVGDVDAPIGVVVGAAVVISLVATAIVPIALNPGQQAANKIFSVTEKTPLDKKAAAGKPAAGKKAKK